VRRSRQLGSKARDEDITSQVSANSSLSQDVTDTTHKAKTLQNKIKQGQQDRNR
jgi:hypothetical protein